MGGRRPRRRPGLHRHHRAQHRLRAGIGERLAGSGESVNVHLEVRGVEGGAISFHTDRGEVFRQTFPGSDYATVWSVRPEEARFEVRHHDGSMAALTNPILLN